MYETFEHTADLGLRVRAADLDTLFGEAAEALTSALVEDPSSVEPRREAAIQVSGTDRAYLLFDWLKELLYRFGGGPPTFRRVRGRVGGDGPGGPGWGGPYGPGRHSVRPRVKGVHFPRLRVEPDPDGGWLAEVIVDI